MATTRWRSPISWLIDLGGDKPSTRGSSIIGGINQVPRHLIEKLRWEAPSDPQFPGVTETSKVCLAGISPISSLEFSPTWIQFWLKRNEENTQCSQSNIHNYPQELHICSFVHIPNGPQVTSENSDTSGKRCFWVDSSRVIVLWGDWFKAEMTVQLITVNTSDAHRWTAGSEKRDPNGNQSPLRSQQWPCYTPLPRSISPFVAYWMEKAPK